MVIRSIDDIQRDKEREKRENFKNQIARDINDVTDKVFARSRTKKKGFLDYVWMFTKMFLGLILMMTVVNLVLGNLWLLKFFVKELFMAG